MKKTMLRILSFLLIFSLAYNFIACSNSGDGGKDPDPEPTSITLSSSTLTLNKGDTYQLVSTVLPSTANQEVNYTSTNPSCATINELGLITALQQGNTTIQAQTTNGLVATCSIQIIDNTIPASITLSTTTLSLTVGDTYQLYAIVSPSSSNQSVSFSSLNPTCATIDSTGLITALTAGNTVIRAETVNGLTAICNVEISIAVGKIVGCITYSNFGSSSSSYPDSGATIHLIPLNIQTFPEDYNLTSYDNYESYGIFSTSADSLGNYEFDNVPTGEYKFIVASENAEVNLTAQAHRGQNLDTLIDNVFGEHIGSFVKTSTDRKFFGLWYRNDLSHEIITIENNKTVTNNVKLINHT